MNNIPNNKITRDCAMKMREAADTIVQLNELVRKCIGIINASKTQLQVKETELDECKTALKDRVAEVENKKNEICSLNTKQEELEIEKKQAEEELGRFKMIIDSTTKSLEEINSLILTTDSSKLSSSASIDLLIDSIKTSIDGLKSQVDDLKQQQLNVKGLEEKQENLIAEKDNEIQRLTEANRKAENELRNVNSKVALAVKTMQELVGMASSITGETFAGGGLDAMVEFLNQNLQSANERVNAWKDQSKVVVEKDNEIQKLIEANKKSTNEPEILEFGTSDATELMAKFAEMIALINGGNFKGRNFGTVAGYIEKSISGAEEQVKEWQGKLAGTKKSGSNDETVQSNGIVAKNDRTAKGMIVFAKEALKRFASMVSLITDKQFTGDDFCTIRNFLNENIGVAESKINQWKKQNGVAKKPVLVKKSDR